MTTTAEKLLFAPTAQLFVLRTLCATLVITVFAMTTGREGATPPLMSFLIGGPVAVASFAIVGLVLGWLGSKGVPLTGLLGWPFLIPVIAGDPLLFVAWLATRGKWPELIPVSSLGLINFAPIIRVVDTGEVLAR